MLPAADYQTDARMALKRQAIPLPPLEGKTVLDVGCDFGYWTRLAVELGASRALGLDRGRLVRGSGVVDLVAMNRDRGDDERCTYERINLGKQWFEFGRFDVVFLFSLYHHIYEACGGDHLPIWFWLRRQISDDGELLWENPLDPSDSVVRRNVSRAAHANYTRAAILSAASVYFDAEKIGPALHEPTREVWRFRPKPIVTRTLKAKAKSGAGGASKAFLHADGRRIGEIEANLGYRPQPGSLNLDVSRPFDWDRHYFRAQVLDVADRAQGLASAWALRWARFYPVQVNGVAAHAFRFEGETYKKNFVELIAPVQLRDVLDGGLTLCSPA